MAAIRRLRAPCDFNPRSLAGATVWDGVVLHEYEFQSTLPRGSDVPAHHHRSCVADFNPRSLAGATLLELHSINDGVNFNPRSLAGATVWDGVVLHEYEFQSTLPRGSDVPAHHHRSCVADFNPRSLAGATSSQSFCFCCRYISIHAPSRERQDYIY